MHKFLLISLLLLTACQNAQTGLAAPATSSPQASPTASATPTPSVSPCGPDCQEIDATVHIDQASPAQACADDTVQVAFSNLNAAYGAFGNGKERHLQLKLVQRPEPAPAGDKGLPPNLGDGSYTLIDLPIDASGKVTGSLKLQASYGPTVSGETFELKAGAQIDLWYQTSWGAASGLPIKLCP